VSINKVLIANRGEIALRILRGCRAEGLGSVAVFSDPDRREMHVRLADEAVPLGGSTAADTYLRMDKILRAAKDTGCDAIHPGYGFLSQNADFADMCDDAGIAFVGPPGSAMRVMGGKVVARRAMSAAGVPVVPGSLDPSVDAREARRTADKIGYPVMLKASAGGGGKGIRMVAHPDELESSFERASAEAVASFGNGEIYVEKCVLNPRHIEIQVMLDRHGNGVHVGERECSVQRRHQKIVEECPANRLSRETRDAMADAGVRAARAVGYVNAGTVEFLVDDEENFYFLEMNTRLQVEHTVTEMVYGVDLVREQLRVAGGRPLSWRQSDLVPRGHAIEIRICAEDPQQGFFPSAGRIDHLETPGGPGVRLDSCLWEGQEITLFYDSMLAKLVCWGQDRPEALARTIQALREFVVSGIRTTIPFSILLLRRPELQVGAYDTGFLDRHLPEIAGHGVGQHRFGAAVAAALVHRERARAAGRKGTVTDRNGQGGGALAPWVAAGRARLLGDRG
jgi:acetyl-CoA carboxylase biotin carboxylase subunit